MTNKQMHAFEMQICYRRLSAAMKAEPNPAPFVRTVRPVAPVKVPAKVARQIRATVAPESGRLEKAISTLGAELAKLQTAVAA